MTSIEAATIMNQLGADLLIGSCLPDSRNGDDTAVSAS